MSDLHTRASNIRGRKTEGLEPGKRIIVRQPNPPKTSSVTHIHKMPVEILVDTFKLFIDMHNSPAIGILLLICRRWYDIVNTTPSLWSRIAFSPTRRDCGSLASYVDTALKKSRSHPLDIYLDLTLTFEEEYPSTDSDSDSDSDTTSNDTDDLNTLLEDLLLRVIGDRGVEVMRWRSYSLHVGDSEVWPVVSSHILALNCPAPLLRELSLHLNEELPLFDSSDQFLPELPSLRALILDAPGSRSMIRCSPERIDTLGCRLLYSLGIVAPFINLRDLAIDIECGSDEDEEDDNDEDIYLRHLDSLTLRWESPSTLSEDLITRIKAPSLTTLRLIGSRAIALMVSLENWWKVKHLHCLARPREPFMIETLPYSTLEHTFMVFEDLESFVTAPWHLEIAKMALEDTRHFGNAPRSLHTITLLIEDTKGEKITGDVSFAQVVTPWKPTNDFIYRSYPLRRRPVQ